MTHLAALEASPRITTVLGRSATSMRDLDTYLVSHEVALVVLGNTLFRSLAVIEFLKEGYIRPRTTPRSNHMNLPQSRIQPCFARCIALLT